MGTPIVGIDLGTTNSLVAWCDERGPRVLGPSGAPLVPSVVRIEHDAVLVGDRALSERSTHPHLTAASTKRLMGRSAAEVFAAGAPHGITVVEGPRGLAAVQLGDRAHLPQEIAAHILRTLALRAQESLGVPITRVVITVPAYFDDGQRQATREAAKLAGLDAVRIVNEPTAAALAYGIGRDGKGAPETVAVFDFGGGTFDVSILSVVPGAEGGLDGEFLQVLATAGDTQLGGDDVDGLIMADALPGLEAWLGAPLTPSERERLRAASEAAKHALSVHDATTMRLEWPQGRWEHTLRRDALDGMTKPLLQRMARCCTQALADAGRSSVDRVVLVGGSTRMPSVRAVAERVFGVEPYTALDPDTVVALGASVQAQVLAGARTDVLLMDVVPLSLGLETAGGAVAKLVMRNSPIPTRATELFSTGVDGQTAIMLHVVQGERELVADCRSLATFELRGLPPMPAGIPQVEVEFTVDANGVLSVHAKERRSGCQARVQVVPAYGLTADEVAQMERDSVTHAREDMHAHRIIDLVVNSKLDVKWIEDARARAEGAHAQPLDPPTRDALEACLARVNEFIATAERDPSTVDADAFHHAKEALDRASVPLHEASIARSLNQMHSGTTPQKDG